MASSTPEVLEPTSEDMQLSRRCWVCQQEDTEDTPGNDVWKTPCPCSLTAHDTCLLEWISNEEAPRPGDIARSRLIRCPQCRAEIKIQRPRDFLVIIYEAIQRMTNAMVLPGAAASLLMCTYAGLLVYGMNTIKVVFGDEDALKILQVSTSYQTEKIWGTSRILANIIKPFDLLLPSTYPLDSLKVFIRTPLIAPSLIILRTRWAHRAFSFLLPLHFINPANQKISWPPPPGLVFATLPYLKTAYDELYRYAFSRLESKWDMAVQRKPRAGETQEEIAFEAEREDAEGFLEIRLALTEEDDDRIPEPGAIIDPNRGRLQRIQQPNLPQVQNPLENLQHAEGLDNNEDAQIRNEGLNLLPQQPDTQNDENINRPNHFQLDEQGFLRLQNNGRRANEERLADTNIPPNDDRTVVHHYHASQLISLVVGALSFPTVASIAGDILKYTLPSSLVSAQLTYSWGTRSFKRGILTEKWGRTVVGGCLFVLLRDAVNLYCKWKKAREFDKRIVIDYVGPKKNPTSV
ncbi:putative ring finger domain-containing protein [Erysiphe neolycopersici]|uniref:Putative ring finger domain-containing protein n=1 Tax=Erysiphe neolycopersici TaxID=212602 RepID=A0A420HKU5_9PEZI|nr:putative ring finger domain-containing protein [Erysiphe neolycopersici]